MENIYGQGFRRQECFCFHFLCVPSAQAPVIAWKDRAGTTRLENKVRSPLPSYCPTVLVDIWINGKHSGMWVS